jgi:hypothetical protein
MKSTVFS